MDTLHAWAWRLALVMSIVVALLSFVSGVSFLQVVLRAMLGFGLIYGLSELSIYLFEKTALSPVPNPEVGAFLDIAVGQAAELPIQAHLPGQVNKELAQGLPDEEKQAEIVRRMGWGD